MDSEFNKERRVARAKALIDLHAKDRGAVFVDAAEYPDGRRAFAAAVVGAATGATRTAASLRTRAAHRAEEVAIALAIADPECTTVWALLLLSLVLLSVLCVCVDIIGNKFQGGTPIRFANTWSTHFWMLFENMFCEASARSPQGTVLRILSGTWWLAIVVLMNAFAGQMRACLMVKTELEKINTLSDVAARPHLKVYLLKDTEITRYLESSKGVAERTIWRMIRRDRSDIYGLFRYSEEMLIEIAEEKAVMLHGMLLSQYEVWALLLLSMALLSVVFACVDVIGAKIQGETPTRVTKAWSAYFWMLFENMLCEASTRPPRGAVLRILSSTWWIAIVVLMNAFAGQMRACLMVKTELEKINTLSDVAARPYLKVYLLKETEITRYLERQG
ncbi:uncharacterized protein LOC144153335 [Haemaphysalis longicornis]